MPYLILSLSVINLLLGLFVFKRTEKNAASYAFLAFAISISIWIFVNFMLRILPSIFLLRISYSLGIVVATAALLWTLYFLNKNIHHLIKFVLIPASVAISVVTGLSKAVIQNLTSISTLGYNGEVGPFFFLYSTYFSTIVALIVYYLFTEYRREKILIRSQQILITLFGLFIFAAVSFLVSFILPSFYKTLEYTTIDNFSSSFFLIAIAYAILKYNLFNIKLVLVELAVLLLNMFLLFNVFTSHATADLVLNISVSVFVLMFSVILVRGIYADIRDRERIEELAKEMEIANERLRALEGQKTEFVSIASHQLRTPLTVIKGYASMILEGTFGSLTADARQAIEHLYKASEKVVSLVEDLLTVSRLEQGRMTLHFESVNFVEFTQATLSERIDDASESGIDMTFTAEENKKFTVQIDPNKFKQVILHILDNSIKFTRSPGGIRVSLTEDNITNKILLSVSDTGAGMTAEQILAIFERFNLKVEDSPVQSENAVKNGDVSVPETPPEVESALQKRTPGIGLYIAKQIIDAHHGILRIESAGIDRGTTVTVELPKETSTEVKV